MECSNPSLIVLQPNNSVEVRTCSQWARMNDCPVKYVSYDDLYSLNGEPYASPIILPVGSVEYMQKAKKCLSGDGNAVMGYMYPYPFELSEFRHRIISSTSKVDGMENMKSLRENPIFIKPLYTKRFTGFVTNEEWPEEWNDLQMAEQLILSTVVKFVSEFRFYVSKGVILGFARYDQNDEENVPIPDINIVNQMVQAMEPYGTYALDVGVLSTGETALVEVNDAWAIGLYGKALSPSDYVGFLYERWLQEWR